MYMYLMRRMEIVKLCRFICLEVQEKLSATTASLRSVYSDPLMSRTPYRLHAVLVHQGEASGGHYWAYIRKQYNEGEGGGGEGHENASEGETVQEVKEEESEQLDGSNESSMEKDQECVVIDIGGGEEEEEEEKMEVNNGDEVMSQENDHSLPSLLSVNEDISLDDAVDTVPLNKASSNVTSEPSVDTSNLRSSGGSVAGSTASTISAHGGGDWLKCNDISVTEVHWEEVQKESFGRSEANTTGNTSAYCLVYVSEETAQGMKNREGIESLTRRLYTCMYVHVCTIVCFIFIHKIFI